MKRYKNSLLLSANMDLIKLLLESILGIIILGFFAFAILPALGQATGRSMGLYAVAMILLMVGIVVGFIKKVME